jgi:hypothetical protein
LQPLPLLGCKIKAGIALLPPQMALFQDEGVNYEKWESQGRRNPSQSIEFVLCAQMAPFQWQPGVI